MTDIAHLPKNFSPPKQAAFQGRVFIFLCICIFFCTGFSMFVRPHHKEQFKELCQGLTGVGCGEGEKQLQQPVQGAENPQGLESWCAGGENSRGQGGE